MSYDPNVYDSQGRSIAALAAEAEKRNTRPSGWKPKGRSKYQPHVGVKQTAKAEGGAK